MSENAFVRCTVSLGRDTLRMCRELARSESVSVSLSVPSAVRVLVRRGYREALREGRIVLKGSLHQEGLRRNSIARENRLFVRSAEIGQPIRIPPDLSERSGPAKMSARRNISGENR